MKNRNDYSDVQKREDDASLPVSFGEGGEEKPTEVTPESYYHNISESARDGEDRYYEIFEKSKHKTLGWSVASLVFGIISVFCCFFGWVGLAFGIVAVVLSVISRISLGFFDGMSVAGLILGIFGIVFGGTFAVAKILIEMGKLKISFLK